MTVSQVPLLDVLRSTDPLKSELLKAFEGVLSSGRYILGPEVTALEKECSEIVGAKHAFGVSSGTDALLLSMMALGVGAGDEVICPTFTFFASAGCIWRTGAKPVFVDILPATFNLDPEDVRRKITSRTKAIMPVHLFGQCADMAAIVEIARERGVAVIEDAAQSLSAEYRGKRAGSLGTFGCFSFFPSKNLGGFGDAGLVSTNDDELAEKARVMRTHGGKPKYYHRVVGGNFRIDAVQAALLRVKLQHLDAYCERRQENAKLYTRLFLASGVAQIAPDTAAGNLWTALDETKPLVLPFTGESRHIYNQYVIRLRNKAERDALQAKLGDKKIGTAIYYPVPMHLQDCFASLGHKQGDFPVAEAAADQSLAIPIFPELTREEIEYVVDAVVEELKSS